MTSIIWDMGGTLVDTYPDVDRVLAGVVRSGGGDIELAEVASLTRRSRHEAIDILSRRFGIPPERFAEAYAELLASWQSSPPPAMAGAREAIAACRSGGGLNLVVTHRDRSSAQLLLDQLRLDIDDMVCLSDGFPRKPDPAMMLEILRRNEIPARSCLAIGDRPIDGQAARAAGIDSYLLGSKDGPHRITSLDQVPALLGRD